ncbi:hypothetical protein HID58_079601, partial [Brassica napus]
WDEITLRPEENHPFKHPKFDLMTVIIQIRTQAMEKLRQKPRIDMETLNYQSTKERKIVEQEGMEFCSVGSSSFSECCPSDLSIEGYITAKVFKVFELERYRAGESMTNLCDCQRWPFGLGRKAALLPPPPKSPAESWSWRKPNRIAPILLFEKS